ncbi:MAG TPA: hypothetical protein VEH29_14635 [Acidimicrobiales bacterium]|nr:hypothetical protein [Acidimicrobiales bacterium]
MTRLVRAVHELALRIDDEAARWGGGLDLRFLWSPGATASAVLLAMGVTPPLAKFRLPDSEYAAWTAGLHGGWVAARLCRVAFPGIDLDVRSAYAAVAVLLGWWRYLTASQVRRHDVTEEFREFLASPDLAASMRGNRTWNRWGLTRVVLRLDGQPVPVETPRPGGGSRMEVRPALSERYDCAWPDAVTATLQAGRPVEVLEAVRLVPVGHQPGLHTVGIPGGELDPAGDPAVALVRRRREAQRARERRLVDAIRAIVNSLVYGNVARFDRDDAAGERPGPLCFPPLACTVAAGCRALLAVFIHELEERGYPAAYWDTDGLIAAGGTSGVLDSDAVRSIAALFDPLDPFGDGESFFKVEAEGTVGVFGQKKYVIVNEAGEVVAHTESGIGGFVPPPGFGARRPSDGRYVVTAEIAQAHLARGDGLLPRLSWEDVAPDWPALERHSLSTPTALDEMPDNLGCRPFSRIVEAISTYGDCHPVALDPGGELADLGLLAFFDARTGPPGEISCHPEATGAFVVDSLRARAVEWGHVADRSPSGPVVLDPLLVRTVGKSGTVFVDDSPQLVYAEVDAASVLLEAARRLRGPLVAEVCGLRPRTARALAVGRQPEPATVAVALSALKERFGPDPLPTLLDLAELAADSCCQWPSCAEATSRPGGSWCPTHARRSGLERAGVFGGAR